MKRRDFVSAAAAALVVPKAMSQVPSSPLLCLGSTCHSGQITNGSSFTVTGSGFGTKSASTPTLYDTCQGTNILTLWDSVWHTVGDGWDETYRAPSDLAPDSSLWGQSGANFVGPATPFRTKYICSACMGNGLDAGDMMFGKKFTVPAVPYYLVCSWYEATSPNWVFGGDNNFKWVVMTTAQSGVSAGYGSTYWYMEWENSGFTSASALPYIDINDDGGAGIGRNAGGSEYHGAHLPNEYYNGCNGWTKRELIGMLTPDGSGFIKLNMSVPGSQPRWNGYLYNNTQGAGTTDYTGTTREFYLGGYRRNYPQATNRSYWSDIYLDIQTSGAKRFALTDTNSLATATVVEYQPYTSWSDSSVTLACSKGNLASGTAYLWLLDEINGDRLIGSYTMS